MIFTNTTTNTTTITTTTTIERLEKELTDTKSVTLSLQQKWLSTKGTLLLLFITPSSLSSSSSSSDSLAAAIITINNLNTKITKLETNLFNLNNEMNTCSEMAIEDSHGIIIITTITTIIIIIIITVITIISS